MRTLGPLANARGFFLPISKSQMTISAMVEYVSNIVIALLGFAGAGKKVDKHNNLVERTYHLEEQQALLEKDIKVANHRISDLEEKAG